MPYKKTENVIVSLDLYYTDCAQRTDRMPLYLYDKKPFNDLKYYVTLLNFENLFLADMGLTRRDHDHPNAWHDGPSHRERFGRIGQWVAHKENPRYTASCSSSFHAPLSHSPATLGRRRMMVKRKKGQRIWRKIAS